MALFNKFVLTTKDEPQGAKSTQQPETPKQTPTVAKNPDPDLVSKSTGQEVIGSPYAKPKKSGVKSLPTLNGSKKGVWTPLNSEVPNEDKQIVEMQINEAAEVEIKKTAQRVKSRLPHNNPDPNALFILETSNNLLLGLYNTAVTCTDQICDVKLNKTDQIGVNEQIKKIKFVEQRLTLQFEAFNEPGVEELMVLLEHLKADIADGKIRQLKPIKISGLAVPNNSLQCIPIMYRGPILDTQGKMTLTVEFENLDPNLQKQKAKKKLTGKLPDENNTTGTMASAGAAKLPSGKTSPAPAQIIGPPPPPKTPTKIPVPKSLPKGLN